MNKIFQNLVQEVVRIKISGTHSITGTLIDQENDFIVIFNGTDFMYLSLNHIQNFEVDPENETDIEPPTKFPDIIEDDSIQNLTLEEVVSRVIGQFVEIYVTGDQSLYGQITRVMSDYLVFESPVYKTMYISLEHLKWLIPYSQVKKPFDLENYDFTLQPTQESLAITFEGQVKNHTNKLVVFNTSGSKSFFGRINDLEKQVIEVQTVKTEPVFLNLKHIKTMHLV